MVFVTGAGCQFLPLAAICRKTGHSFISFLFHVPATLGGATVFSCDARNMGCENICDILGDVFGCRSFGLAVVAGVGRGALFVWGGAWRWGRFGGAAGRGLRWGSGYLSSGQLGWACGLWVVSLCSPFAGFCWICCAGVAAVIFGLPQVG